MLSDYGRLKFAFALQQLTQWIPSKMMPPEGSQTDHSHWKKKNQSIHSNWLKHLVENFPNNKCPKNFIKIRKNIFLLQIFTAGKLLKQCGKFFKLWKKYLWSFLPHSEVLVNQFFVLVTAQISENFCDESSGVPSCFAVRKADVMSRRKHHIKRNVRRLFFSLLCCVSLMPSFVFFWSK